MPQGFKDYIANNEERIKVAEKKGTLPYFIKDNPQYVEKVTGTKNDNSVTNSNAVSSFYEQVRTSMSPSKKLPKELEEGVNAFIENNKGMFSHTSVSVNSQYLGKEGEMMRNVTSVENGKRTDTIIISSADCEVVTKGRKVKFNPLKEFENAMTKIKSGEQLAFREEYAIESLWHEMMHASSVGWTDFKNVENIRLNIPVECVNQFCARRS